MLIKFFKSSYLSQYILLIIIGIVIWIKAFITPHEIPESGIVMPFYNLIFYCFNNIKWLAVLIAFLLLYLESLILNKILTDNNIVPKTTLVPAFIYLLLMSWSPFATYLNPVLIANLFLLLLLNNLFKIFRQHDAFRSVFKVGFFIAIASFFYFPAIFIFILVFATLIVFRVLKWREWVISLIGVIIPYIFLIVYYFWFDKLEPAFDNYVDFFSTYPELNFKCNFLTYSIWIIALILLIISLLHIFVKINEKNISIRKKLVLIIYFFVIAIIIFFYNLEPVLINNSIIIIPISALIAVFLSEIKKTFWLELIFILLIVIIILNNYFYF